MRPVLAALAGAALAATVTLTATSLAGPGQDPPRRSVFMRTPCHADGTGHNCAWNARAHGGGRSSYTHTTRLFDAHIDRVGRVQCVLYVGRAYARANDWCVVLSKNP